MRKLSAVLLVLAGVLIGVLGSGPVFFAAASKVSSPLVLVLISTAFVVLATAGMAWLGFRVVRAGQPAARGFALAGPVGAVFLTGMYFALLRPPVRPPAMALPGPEVQYWQLPTGSRIAYVKSPAVGEPRPTPVIMLHGGPGAPMLPSCLKLRGHAPLDTLPKLGYDVYYYDQMGCGYSSRLDLRRDPPYTIARTVDDLEAIRVAIGSEKMILMGWSYGAVLAAHYMLRYPDRVEKVVFESPGPLVEDRKGDFVPGAHLSPADSTHYVSVQRPTFRIAIGAQLAMRHSRAAFHLVPDWEVDRWLERSWAENFRLRQFMWASCADTDGVAMIPLMGLSGGSGVGFFLGDDLHQDLARLGDIRPRLRENRTSALVLHPQCDIMSWSSALDYRKTFPNCRLAPITDSGHLIWYSQPQVHASVIAAFVTDAPLPIADCASETEPW